MTKSGKTSLIIFLKLDALQPLYFKFKWREAAHIAFHFEVSVGFDHFATDACERVVGDYISHKVVQ